MKTRAPHPMTHARRWTLAAAALAALLAAAWLALWAWLPDDEALARRVEAGFEARMGQPLKVGTVRWRLLGVPMVEVRDAHTVQPEPIVADPATPTQPAIAVCAPMRTLWPI